MKFRWIVLVPPLLLIAGCGTVPRSGGYYEDDGPEASPPADVASIPDAVPVNEPRSATGNNPYVVYGKQYIPVSETRGYRERGVASWYGKKFHGRRTSSGEPYDMYGMTAAHKTLPLPSYVRVRNLQNDRVVVVRVNDRGPFLHDRLIDLSYAAAARLGILGTGTGVVEIEAVHADESAAQAARVKTFPLQVIAPAAAAEPIPVAPAPAPAPATTPKLFLQVGSFTVWENAVNLRNRLEREALGSVTIQPLQEMKSTIQDTSRVYRVRVGPLAGVEEGDRLTARLVQLGVTDARIVVE